MASENFDGNTLRKAQNYLRKDQTGLFRDSQTAGLALRVYKTKASWMMILRDGKWTIAPFEMFTAEDIPALRQLVVEARQLLKEGREPQELFDAFREQRDVDLAKNKAAVVHGLGKTWEEVRDAYLSWAKDNKKEDTVRGYKSALGWTKGSVLERDFEPLHGKPVASITTQDLVHVRSNIVDRGRGEDGGKIRQANLTVAALKACFKWYLNQRGSTIKSSPAQDLGKASERVRKIKKSADEERTFTQDEIGLLIYGLEFSTNPAARLCLMLQLLTGQRRMTVCVAHKADFVSTDAYPMLWRLDDKVDAWRVLPLPPTARQIVEQAASLSRSDNVFLFPQQRPARAGDPMDGHLNERTVSTVIEEMRVKGGMLENLPFTPSTHSLRRAFITTMTTKMSNFDLEGVQMRPEDVDRITHRNEGRSSTASAVYDKNAYLDAKLQILEFWEQWCLEGYDRVKRKMEKAT